MHAGNGGAAVDTDMKALPVDEVVARVGVARAIAIKHVASLLFTYRCTIACDHCLFHCSPARPGVRASLDDGVEFLGQLRATDRVVHIAGGEALMYFGEVLAICRAADRVGAAPHFIETNASWCVSDAVTRTRLLELRDAGVRGVLLSADPYHQRFVPPAYRERAYRLAADVFGTRNVAAPELSTEALSEFRSIARDPARLAQYARDNPPLLVGRAGEALAGAFPDRPLDDLVGDTLWHGPSPGTRGCASELDPETMWEVHIDPYGNVQTCCGIVLGSARVTPLPDLMRSGFAACALARLAAAEGPFGLLALAEQHGYARRPEGYKQKCHLCWEVRKFLRPHYPETFGPAEVYDPV